MFMNQVRALCSTLLLLAGLLAIASPARADEAGDRIIRSVDEALNRYRTLDFRYDLVTHEPGGGTSRMKVHAQLRGRRQLTELLAPADVKGTRVLIVSPKQMYVYLPAFHKIRRIASHVGGGSFMGTAFSADDMSLLRYADDYQAKLLGEKDGHYRLELRSRPGHKTAYARILMRVERARMLPTDMKYFTAAGRHLKTESRRDYVCEQGVCQARRMKMVHHGKGDLWTLLKLTRYAINPKLPARLFSKRSLQR